MWLNLNRILTSTLWISWSWQLGQKLGIPRDQDTCQALPALSEAVRLVGDKRSLSWQAHAEFEAPGAFLW